MDVNNQILSLGAGVQSSTLLIMALEGKIERPDCAIFSDTGFEPKRVYNHLDHLIEYSKKKSFDIHVVRQGNIKIENMGKERSASMPYFLQMADGVQGTSRRQCTYEYKIKPLYRKCREFGANRKSPINLWIGISTDEAMRMKESQVLYIKNRWPLIELNYSREKCIKYLKSIGWLNVPESSCIACPYHNNKLWKNLKENEPDDFKEAVEFEKSIQNNGKFHGKPFLHREMIPLPDVDFRSIEDMGQINLFNNECEGMCGN